jgi:hypothetical protein
MKITRNPFAPLVAASFLPLILPLGAQTWDGNGIPDAGGNWSTAVNWSDDIVPIAGATAILGDAGADRTIIYDANASGSLGSIIFNQSSAFLNILEFQRSATISNAIVLGTSAGL